MPPIDPQRTEILEKIAIATGEVAAVIKKQPYHFSGDEPEPAEFDGLTCLDFEIALVKGFFRGKRYERAEVWFVMIDKTYARTDLAQFISRYTRSRVDGNRLKPDETFDIPFYGTGAYGERNPHLHSTIVAQIPAAVFLKKLRDAHEPLFDVANLKPKSAREIVSQPLSMRLSIGSRAESIWSVHAVAVLPGTDATGRGVACRLAPEAKRRFFLHCKQHDKVHVFELEHDRLVNIVSAIVNPKTKIVLSNADVSVAIDALPIYSLIKEHGWCHLLEPLEVAALATAVAEFEAEVAEPATPTSPSSGP